VASSDFRASCNGENGTDRGAMVHVAPIGNDGAMVNVAPIHRVEGNNGAMVNVATITMVQW
jgi:hypothetical protein